MIAFTKRNILVYFRDKTAVFFSLFAVLILIVLYVVFLGDLIAEGLSDFPKKNALLATWFIAGILAVTSMTTTLGSFGVFVEDRANQTILDFYASPIPRAKLVSGYIFGALFVGVLMSLITGGVSLLYLMLIENISITINQVILIIATIFLSVLASASIVLFLVSFLHTSNAFAAVSMVIGTLIGFLAGIYIPIGSFPDYIQIIIKIFPLSHSAALLRQILMEGVMSSAFVKTPTEIVTTFQLDMGIRFELNSKIISNIISVGYLVFTTIVFSSFALLNIQKNK